MLAECDGCNEIRTVQPVYEGDDPSTGYVGSTEPEYLCWECRHPEANAIIAAERRAVEYACYLLGLHETPRKPAALAAGKTVREVVA